MIRQRTWVGAWLAVCFLACTLAARAASRSLADDYVIRVWDNSRGVQHPTVRSLAQAPDGTILAGTFEGLARIDGNRARWEVPGNLPDSQDHFIISLLVDRHGDTWAGTGRSILRQHNGVWARMPAPDSFLVGAVGMIVEGAQGRIYFACGGSVAKWDGQAFEILPSQPRSTDDSTAVKIETGSDGTLWASCRSRLCRWNNTEWIVEAEGTDTVAFRGLGRCNAGGVWVAAGDKITQRIPGAWRRELQLPKGVGNDHTVFAEGNDGTLYAGLFDQGLVIFSPNGQITTATEADGLSNTQIPAIMIDREGSIWLGTGAGGAMQLIPRRFRVLNGYAPLSAENHISALMREPDGRVLYATHTGHFYHSDGVTAELDPRLSENPDFKPRALLRDQSGTVWCANKDRALWFFTGGRWQQRTITTNRIHDLQEMPDGSVWIGHEDGYIVMDSLAPNRAESFATNLHAAVHHIVKAADGAIWLATSKGAYMAPPGERKAIWQPLVAGTNNLCQLAFDPDGTLWTTTDTSLIRVAGAKRFEFGPGQGVKILQSSSLLRDDGGNWWIGTFKGIVRLDRRSLDAVSEGRDSRVPQALYNRHDGLLTEIAWIDGFAGGVRGLDGKLWIATRHGLVVFDPRRFPLFPVPPKVTIEAVTTDATTNRIAGPTSAIELSAQTTSFSVEFSAVEPAFGDRAAFEYQIGAVDSPWIGVDNNERIRFPSVKPGIFNIRIRASNIDGVRSGEPAAIQVLVPERFFERGVVRIGGLAAILGLTGTSAFLLQRRRAARRRVQEEADRRQALEHARFASLLRATADLVLFADPDRRVSYINDSGRRMLRIPATMESKGLDLCSLLSRRSRDDVNRVFSNFRAENDLWRGVVEFEDSQGTPITAQIAILAHRCADGSIDFYSVAGHDLREVLQAESAKREIQEMLQLVSDSVPIRMGFLGPDLRYRWASGEVGRALQLPLDKIIGHRLQDIWDEKSYGAVRSALHRALAGEPQRIEVPLECRGGVRHYAASFLPHASPSGEIAGVLIVAVDLTEQKESDDRRRSLEDQLQQRRKLEALGTLAGGVAHDFNNLLSVILGNVDMARFCEPLPDAASDALDEIQKASQRARDIVRQILLFSRQLSQKREAVDTGSVVKEVVGSLRSTIPASIRIEAELDACAPVLADVTQIHQVISNLINNAAQAIRGHRGLIVVRLRSVQVTEAEARGINGLKPGSFARLSITDNGAGMDDTTLRRIFEPFFTTKPVGQGTGLGLAVVHGIVEAHGGSVAVESKLGSGTTFTIYLPVMTEIPPAAPASVNAPRAEMALGHGQNILLVDDETAVLNLAKSMLVRFGYTVEAFSDAQAAAELFESDPQRFAVVVTDLTMPVMNGLALAKRIRARDARTPIVLTSGMAAAVDEESAAAHGVSRILAKPYRLTELAVTLAQLLGAKNT